MSDPTDYVILKRVDPTTPGQVHPLANEVLWLEVGRIAHGSGREAAVRAFADDDKTLEPGDHEFRAVPVRSWDDEPVTISIRNERTVSVRQKEHANA